MGPKERARSGVYQSGIATQSSLFSRELGRGDLGLRRSKQGPAQKKRQKPTRGALGKSTIKRAAILEAAAKVFCERGYANATLNEIAERSGTQAGSLYYYFSSREHLVEEVLKGSMSTVFDEVRAAIDHMPVGARWIDKIVCGVKTHMSVLLSGNIYALAYMKIIGQVPDDVRSQYSTYPRAYGRYWSAIFEGAKSAGEIRGDLNLAAVKMLIFGSITYTLEWFAPNSPLSADQLAEHLCHLFLDGLRPLDEKKESRLKGLHGKRRRS